MADSEIVKRNVAKVREFLDAWGAVDPDWAMACLSDDIGKYSLVYDNDARS